MYGWWQELVFGARTQLRTPVATLAVILTLALGIAAINVAFSLVNSFFLRPLPVEEPQRLVRIYSSLAGGLQHFTVSFADYADMRELRSVFSGVIVEAPVAVSLRASGANERVWGEEVSGDYFSVLGIRPVYGRFFTAAADGPNGGEPVIVLSYGLWQRRFGGSRGVLDETVLVNGQPWRVIGVAPENFHGITLGLKPELWRPVSGDANRRGGFGFFAMARLQPRITPDHAAAALDLLARRLQQSYPDSNRGVRFTVLPEADGRVHPMVRGSILGFSAVLVAVAAVLLLVACANVAGLLLVRGVTRGREIAVRIALGATRARIVRQLLTESVSLALIAGGVGLAIAWMVTRLLSAIHLPTRVPLFVDFGLDERVLVFSFLITVLSAGLFGLAPALEGARFDPISIIKSGTASGLRSSRLRSALVVVQVGLATVLLIGGGLFGRSLHNAGRVDIGFEPRGIVMAAVDLGLQGYSAADARQFWRRLVDRIAALPRTVSVSLANTVPFYMDIQQISMGPQGYPPAAAGGWPPIDVATVGSGYFRTMGIPVLEGREFSERDTDASPLVVIVNDVLARQFWRGTSALGKRVTTGRRDYEVIGVARRTKHLTLAEDPKPYVYFPLGQHDTRAMTVLARGAGDPVALLRDVRHTLHAMDETLPLYNATTMSEHVAVAQLPATSGALVLGLVGLVALCLTSVGLYGTMAHTVFGRTYEIGVRRALGALDEDVILLVMRQAMIIVLCGLAIGMAVGFAGSRFLAGLLYGVETNDPLVFTLAPVVLMLVCVVACWTPASRAIRIEPANALRHDQ